MSNYYEILGINNNATKEEIKKAYKKVALEAHPDKHPEETRDEATSRFKKICEAYGVLSDDAKRDIYDRFGADAVDDLNNLNAHNNEEEQPHVFMGNFPKDFFTGLSGFGEFEFSKMFSGMNGSMGGFKFKTRTGSGSESESSTDSSPDNDSESESNLDDTPVQDLHIEHEITLELLYTGTTVKKSIYRFNLCKKCEGSGTKKQKASKCTDCEGSGNVQRKVKKSSGTQTISEKCRKCKGSGKSNKVDKTFEPCNTCSGNRVCQEEYQIEFKVYPGAYSGTKITIENEGHQIPKEYIKDDKTRTNIIIHLDEIPHQVFKRNFMIESFMDSVDPADLLVELEISLGESLCGFSKKITHLSGSPIDISYNTTVKPEDILVYKNMGMEVYTGKTISKSKKLYGNLYIHLKVKYPEMTKINKEQIWKALEGSTYKQVDDQTNNLVSIENYKSTTDDKPNNKPKKSKRKSHKSPNGECRTQ